MSVGSPSRPHRPYVRGDGAAATPKPVARGSRGFTVIELCIAITILVILFIKLSLIVNEASETHRRESASMALEDQARTVLDRISFAVIGSDRDTILPDPESPFWTNKLRYRISLGVEEGEVVWSDPEIIQLDDQDRSELYWITNEGTSSEQAVVWCRTVAEFFANELANGEDDNLNGLTDESGLTFALEGSSVRIRLTLERETKEGPIRVTDETVVTCRN